MIGSVSSMYSAAATQRLSPQDLFAQQDTDGSEGISQTELEGTELAEKIGDDFALVDTDGNGELSATELKTHHDENKGDRPPPPPPPPSGSGDSDLNQSIVSALLSIAESLSEDTDETTSVTDVLATDSTADEATSAAETLLAEAEDDAASLADILLEDAEEDEEDSSFLTA